MVSELIKKLRTCKLEQRKDVAMKLVEDGSEESINELKKMVIGLNPNFFRQYKIEDMLIGIEALGYTKNKEILEFLKKIYTSEIDSRSETIPAHYEFFGSDQYEAPEETKEYTVTIYPNAPNEELRHALQHPWTRDKCNRIFENAISHLEKDL